jgi:hypothetical protein
MAGSLRRCPRRGAAPPDLQRGCVIDARRRCRLAGVAICTNSSALDTLSGSAAIVMAVVAVVWSASWGTTSSTSVPNRVPLTVSVLRVLGSRITLCPRNSCLNAVGAQLFSP